VKESKKPASEGEYRCRAKVRKADLIEKSTENQFGAYRVNRGIAQGADKLQDNGVVVLLLWEQRIWPVLPSVPSFK
jgi:hypothetical protein